MLRLYEGGARLNDLPKTMKVPQFLPLHAIRSPNIGWFLGAGASAAAGIPTAVNMIWDFKRTLYCANYRLSVGLVQDLGDPNVQSRLQLFLDTQGGHPPLDVEEEYPHYFEAVYPSETDRRRYIDRQISGASPSIGHRALAALMAADKVRLIWTTNFDRLPEDAGIRVLGASGRVTVAALDNPRVASDALNEGRWPLIGKLHGDFQSRRLKNTSDELRAQDAELRHAFVESCRRFGLAVVGYSGRDASIMDSLEDAIAGGRGFPHGLFWFHRSGSVCLPRVHQLIERAAAAGVDAHLVESETFDEVIADLTLLHTDIPQKLLSGLDRRAQRISPAPIPPPGHGWPILRTNALPLVDVPEVCRRVECAIGGTAEVLSAIQTAGADVFAGRTKVGVIAFGSDADIRRTFESYGITGFDLHSIEKHRLRYQSTEFGLLQQALARAIERERPLTVERRGKSYFARPCVDADRDPTFAKLRAVVQTMTGTLPSVGLKWSEALRLRVDYRLNRLWLLVEPTIWIDWPEEPNPACRKAGLEFARERLARRYNATWNGLLDAWSAIVLSDEKYATLRAFGIGDGVDASFRIASATGFSRP